MEVKFAKDKYNLSDESISQLRNQVEKYVHKFSPDDSWITLHSAFVLRMLEDIQHLRRVIYDSFQAKVNFDSRGLELIKSVCKCGDEIMFSKVMTPDYVLALVADLEHAREELACARQDNS